MSTILKALRRLEEDGPAHTADSSDSLPATDPLAADELRERILAEELAAQAAAVAQHESGRTRRFALMGAAALLTLVLGVGVYMMSTRTSSDENAQPIAATQPPSSPPAPIAAPQVEGPHVEEALVGAAVAIQPIEDQEVVSLASVPSPTETPPKPDAKMALAAVTPTPSALAANPDRPLPATGAVLAEAAPQPQRSPQRSHPEPATSSASPPSVSAPKPASPEPHPEPRPQPKSTSTSPPRSTAKPPPPIQNAEPAKSQATPATRQVEQHKPHVPAPRLTILRTSWHPRSDRRSAKIRLDETKEVLTLREGDAVGGLVIQEISPSAVVFKSGDVEIHRRVGQSGSGG